MALRETQIPIQFAGGINTKTDPKRVPTAQLLAMENAVFRRDATQIDGNGTDALCKRNGYEALSGDIVDTAGSPASTRALGVRDDELLLFTDDRCYSRIESLDSWIDAGPVFSTTLTDRVVAKTGAEQTDPDSCVLYGVRFVVWSQAGGIWWLAIDDATGRVMRSANQLIASGQSPRVSRAGEVVHIYYAVPSDGRIYASAIAIGNLSAVPVQTLLVDDLSASVPAYDVVSTANFSNSPAIAWQSATSLGPRWGYVSPDGRLGSPGGGYPAVVSSAIVGSQGPICIDYDNFSGAGNFIVAHHGTLLNVEYINETLLDSARSVSTSGVTSAQRISVRFRRDLASGFQVADLIIEDDATTTRDHLLYRALIRDAGVSIAVESYGTSRGLGLVSRAFLAGADAFAWTCHDTDAASVYLLARISDGAIVARYLPNGAAHGLATVKTLGNASFDTATSIATWPATYNEIVESSTLAFTETGIRIASVAFADDNSHQSGQLGECLYLSGGVVSQYDGERWAEAGFHVIPDKTTTTPSAGGALTASSSYLYAIGYEDINAQGELDRGPVASVAVALGVGQTRVTFQVPTYRFTARRNVRIGVWRSPANDPSALYRVTSLNPSATSGSNRFIPNDKTVDTLTFIDDMSDATLITGEPLYTTGDIPSNDPIAGGSVLVVGKGRVFTTDPVDPLLVRYSQQLADGFGVEFVPRLSIKVDPFGGPITGLAVLDDALVIFKRDGMFMVAGSGPLANPDANPSQGFSDPQLITSDVGCARAESIGPTPVGVIFQSRKGIYMLGRDRQVSYVGAPVEAFNTQAIRRTTLLPDRTQIVMLTDAGSTLLYDYNYGQWSTFTNHEGADAIVVGATYHYLRNDDRVFRETPGVFRDANSHIPMGIETAWIKLAGYCQGFQRIYHAYVLGRYVSAHMLRLRAQYDYEDGWSKMWDLDVDTNYTPSVYGAGAYGDGEYGGASTTRYQKKVHVGRKCQAVRFRFEDIESTDNYGACFELSELLVTGGVKRGAPKVGAARSD